VSDSTKSATSGLRATKKQQTEAEILANAIGQFREHGVRGALLADVARASRVSPATLFNYFANKGALAEAWIRGEIDEVLVNVSRDLGDHGLRPAMRSLCRRLANQVSEDRPVRLQAWRESGRSLCGTR
jgi:AcrR family transcriptional regulator